MIITSESLGFTDKADCTLCLIRLSEKLKEISEPSSVIFTKGSYYIDADKCCEVYRAITNTAGKSEYKDKSRINLHRVPFLFKNVSDFVFDGNGSEFIISGKVTNMIISGCENITFKNLSIRTLNPNLHCFTVKKSTPFKTVFTLNRESEYIKKNGKFYFTGKGYTYGFTENVKIAWWTVRLDGENKNLALRSRHPFDGSFKIRESGKNEFKVYYPVPRKFKAGQSFCVYDCLRDDVGIFAENSRNLVFENVEQNFNYSLAFVAQKCENITLENCRFVPEKGSGLGIASLADFMQICMCGGKIKVKGCLFDGAGDDAINVHGIHFKIKNIRNNTLTAVFGHSQTWGFNPLSSGDTVEFIDSKTLISKDSAHIISSRLVSDGEIEVTVDKNIPDAYEKYALEDITLCPELEYTDNEITRIVTRGILYTSRGKCVIKNNLFRFTGMSGVLFSDDAESWFESGMCKDVTVEDNIFDETGENAILIKPENRSYAGAVHENFRIIGNTFKKYAGDCISIKATDNVLIKDNSFANEARVKTEDCHGISCDF